jgi:hypothetical protein
MDRARRDDWLKLIGLALGIKATLIVVGVIAHGLGQDGAGGFLGQWSQWDAVHYQFIAQHGYPPNGDGGNVVAWLPVYPYVVGAVGVLGMDLRLSGMLVTNISSLVATILLYELALSYGDARAAFRTAAFWNIFPTAYFLFTGYPEALFCALLFGAVLALRRHAWLVAGLCGGAASGTRISGLALLPLMAYEIYAGRALLKSLTRALLSMALVPVGFLLYLFANWRGWGDPFAFATVERRHFYEEPSPPWKGLVTAWNLATRAGESWDRFTVGAANALGGISFFAISILSYLRLTFGDFLFAVAMTLINTCIGFWIGMPRYLLAVYPLFLLLGRVRNATMQALLAGSSLVGLVVLAAGFTGGRWAF